MMNDFYVGYLPKAPAALARFVRRAVFGLGVLATGLALLLVLSQNPFAKSVFEYGTVRSFEGVVVLQPYPSLWVQRPGTVSGEDEFSQYLLVAPGKHGAEGLLAGFGGQTVRLRGQLIFREDAREGRSMIEVVPGSIELMPRSSPSPEKIQDLGPLTVAGEIVDSKCYLGVMNPGRGKVHRDCAARCISGGIPPIFITTQAETPDGRDQFLLIGADGRALGPDALRDFIAEPITIRGELLRKGDAEFLQIDPGALRHSSR